MTITRAHTQQSPTDAETAGLADLARAAHHRGASPEHVEVTIAGRSAEVPPEVAGAIGDVLQAFVDRQGVVIGGLDETLTTGRAAQMLGISRTYLCTLVDEGRIPCQYVGTHRRIKTVDVLEYAEKRRSRRQAELDKLAELSREAGLYDDDF